MEIWDGMEGFGLGWRVKGCGSGGNNTVGRVGVRSEEMGFQFVFIVN